MATRTTQKFAVDVITYFHPDFWGQADQAALVTFARENGRAFWDRMLDSVAASGISALELTFSPIGWADAIAAYGSLDGLSAELAARRQSIVASFFSGVARGDYRSGEGQAAILNTAADHCRFLQAVGGEVLVVSLPLRNTATGESAFFVDLEWIRSMADLVNRLGLLARRHGVKLGLHPESHSTFWHGRDIDAFMMATDPTYVGFCPDTAHMTLSGADPVRIAERHAERIVLTHWKDATGTADIGATIDATIYQRNRPLFRGLGLGDVRWRDWQAMLSKAGYSGHTVIELDAAEKPLEDVRHALNFVQNVTDRAKPAA